MATLPRVPVTVTYKDEDQVWPEFPQAFASLQPLRDLVWITPAGEYHPVPFVHVQLRRQTSVQDLLPSGPRYTWDERPFVHLNIVQCNDSDAYKKQVRPRLRQWVDNCVAAGAEYLIVYAEKPGAGSGRLTFRRTYDRLRSDFNDKEDRCVQLQPEERAGDSELWQEFVSKVSETIVSAFSVRVSLFQEEIEQQLAQRRGNDANPCSLLLFYEALAHLYLRFQLADLALAQYAAFTTAWNDESAPRMRLSSFGLPDSRAASRFVLSTNAIDYRAALVNGTISEVDLLQYVLARQAALLLPLRRSVTLAALGVTFVRNLERRVFQPDTDTAAHLASMRVFTAAYSLSEACRQHPHPPPSGHADALVFRNDTGELCFLARQHLDRLYAIAQAEDVPAGVIDCLKDIPFLYEQVASENAYHAMYITLSSRAAEAFQDAVRTRMVMKVNGDIARVLFAQRKYEQAEAMLKPLATMYSTDGWQHLVYSVREQLAECQRALGHHVEYVNSCLGLLHPEAERPPAEKAHLMDEMSAVARDKLTDDMVRDLSPVMSVTVAFDGTREFVLGDRVEVVVRVFSTLPEPMTVDELSIRVSDHASGLQVRVLTSKAVTLNPGATMCMFLYQADTVGVFHVDCAWARVGRLTLNEPLRLQRDVPGFRVFETPDLVSLDVLPPPVLLVQAPHPLTIVISCKAADVVDEARLRLDSSTGLRVLASDDGQAVVYDQDGAVVRRTPVSVVPHEDILLPGIAEGETVVVLQVLVLAEDVDAVDHSLECEALCTKSTRESFITTVHTVFEFQRPFLCEAHESGADATHVLHLQLFNQSEHRLCMRQPVLSLPPSHTLIPVAGVEAPASALVDPSAETSLLYQLRRNIDVSGTPEDLPGVLELVYQPQEEEEEQEEQEGQDGLGLGGRGDTSKRDGARSLGGGDSVDAGARLPSDCRPSIPALYAKYDGWFMYRIHVPLAAAASTLFSIRTSCDGSAVIGRRFPVRVSVRRVAQTSKMSHDEVANAMFLTLHADPSQWLVEGATRSRLDFRSNQDDAPAVCDVTCSLLPIVPGYLPFPVLLLDGVDPGAVAVMHDVPQIRVDPVRHVLSACDVIR